MITTSYTLTDAEQYRVGCALAEMATACRDAAVKLLPEDGGSIDDMPEAVRRIHAQLVAQADKDDALAVQLQDSSRVVIHPPEDE